MSPAGGGARTFSRRLPLALILCVQLLLGVAYALGTPAWQAPDEPAHVQYVVQVADPEAPWPTIEPADYPAAIVARVMARQSVSEAELRSLRYEDHQPPLYYLLAGILLRVSGVSPAGESLRGPLLQLRLLGVLLSLLTTCLCWRWVRLGWPDRPRQALAAAGFAAFLPMHASVSASANNDALALPLVAAVLVASLGRATQGPRARHGPWLGGGLLGAALLTKLTAYVAVVPLLLAEWQASRGSWPRRALRSAAPLAVGVAIAAPWWIRNAQLYGPDDPWALGAHARAVRGQLTTEAFVAAHGMPALLRRALLFTFDGFWGVFGWMSVFLPTWVYAALAAACALSLLGLALRLRRGGPTGAPERARERAALILGGATLAASALGLSLYNLRFVQHQGRYLLPALVPVAAVLVLGARETCARATLGLRAPWPRRAGAASLLAWPLGLLLLACWALLRFVQPGLLPTP